VVLNAQVQYQRSRADSVNVFPLLGGANETASFSAPFSSTCCAAARSTTCA
jgi:hypothetical protein